MPNKFQNQLASEKSPYLLQHAQNPVNWYPWGKDAFDIAQKENKPVLLSIGYSTCHWCHVMAHESFEDESIAKIINEHFVAVKVDREERPDIDHIYMTAVTAMTGQGGWPLTVFLTPQAEPFFGGTYFPPYAKWGSVGFIELLNSITSAWNNDRDGIFSSSRSIMEGIQSSKSSELREKFSTLEGEKVLQNAYRHMHGQFDATYGGFGNAPKFPMGHGLSFLLRYQKRSGESQASNMVEKTLNSMAQGGIWDHLAGGFHRYSTDRQWHVPHFEKMLYDQAILSRAYLEAYQVTGSIEYAQVAREIFDYVLNDMTDAQGGFYSAEDADSLEDGHSKEGAFYVFAQKEIEEILGQDEAQIFNFCYGILPDGNVGFDPHGEFKGKNILFQAHSIQEAAARFNRQDGQIQDILDVAKQKLLTKRLQRSRPHLDDKVLCDWNGLMISSMAFGARVLGDEEYIRAACRAADFILTQMMKEGRLLHRWRQGSAGISATLDDYAFFINGLLEVYEACFQEKYMQAAHRLAQDMIQFFQDEAGGFYMTANDAQQLIMRPKDVYDGALPSGNSGAAIVLLKLHTLTHQAVYLEKVEALFSCFASQVARMPSAYTFLLSALDWHLSGALEITFEQESTTRTVDKMLKVLYKHFVPFKVVQVDVGAKGGRAILCRRGSCQAPTNSVDDFEKELVKEVLKS